ncbi:MAG: hypothetical protein ABMA01_04710 [Chthoniobacteraceae bacterium]
MNSTDSRPKKSPSSKALRRSSPEAPGARRSPASPSRPSRRTRWDDTLPAGIERDTLLWPEAIAESVVQEASRYLNADLPPDFPERLAAKARHLYPRHRHFHRMLNAPGNRGRQSLYMYMRHWLCAWLKRQRPALYRKLPWEYALGKPLPFGLFSGR